MKALERLRIVIEPHPAKIQADGTLEPSMRSFGDYDRLASELQHEMGVPVEVVEQWLADVPRNDMLLVVAYMGTRNTLVADAAAANPGEARPLVLELSRRLALSSSEAMRPAGVVMSERLGQWRVGAEQDFIFQIYGLKSLAPLLAPLLVPYPFATENYSAYTLAGGGEVALPVVLAKYINAYWRSLYGT